jgi:hypothetical protein
MGRRHASREEIWINAATSNRDVGVFDAKPKSMKPRVVRTACYYGRDPSTTVMRHDASRLAAGQRLKTAAAAALRQQVVKVYRA